MSEFRELQSKLESCANKKEDIDRQVAGVNKGFNEINAAINQIKEEIARIRPSKRSLEAERARLEAIRSSLATANQSILACVKRACTQVGRLLNRLKDEAPETMAAKMELKLVEVESREIPNKVLFFAKMIERM